MRGKEELRNQQRVNPPRQQPGKLAAGLTLRQPHCASKILYRPARATPETRIYSIDGRDVVLSYFCGSQCSAQKLQESTHKSARAQKLEGYGAAWLCPSALLGWGARAKDDRSPSLCNLALELNFLGIQRSLSAATGASLHSHQRWNKQQAPRLLVG